MGEGYRRIEYVSNGSSAFCYESSTNGAYFERGPYGPKGVQELGEEVAIPVKEFDTEIFQTDARELSNELPDLADDFSSTRGDIPSLLPEHSPRDVKSARGKRQNLLREPTESVQISLPT
nr:hypothetical transcript [Hymenolepis microstoma]